MLKGFKISYEWLGGRIFFCIFTFKELVLMKKSLVRSPLADCNYIKNLDFYKHSNIEIVGSILTCGRDDF